MQMLIDEDMRWRGANCGKNLGISDVGFRWKFFFKVLLKKRTRMHEAEILIHRILQENDSPIWKM